MKVLIYSAHWCFWLCCKLVRHRSCTPCTLPSLALLRLAENPIAVSIVAVSLFCGVISVNAHSMQLGANDKAALQRGAAFFMNYCSGCHALRYLRYNRMALDLGLTTFDGSVDSDLLTNNLLFTSAKQEDAIQISMPAEDALKWFGVVPPDLSLIAREKGPVWLLAYLTSFYADDTRPFGSNNLLAPDTAMPNVLAPLLGRVIADERGSTPERIIKREHSHLRLVTSGVMQSGKSDRALQDLVTFLVYVAEPARTLRYQIGPFILLFLAVFFLVAYRLMCVVRK